MVHHGFSRVFFMAENGRFRHARKSYIAMGITGFMTSMAYV